MGCAKCKHHPLEPRIEHKFAEADLSSARGRIFLCLPTPVFLIPHPHTIYPQYLDSHWLISELPWWSSLQTVAVGISYSLASHDPSPITYNPLVLFLYWTPADIMCETAIESLGLQADIVTESEWKPSQSSHSWTHLWLLFYLHIFSLCIPDRDQLKSRLEVLHLWGILFLVPYNRG